MKKICICIFLIAGMIMISSCDKTASNILIEKDEFVNETSYIIFGTFYGFCQGGQCIELFKLTETGLHEDTLDVYPPGAGDYSFVKLDDDLFQQVKEISVYIPNQLIDGNDTFIGCPDCVDQGGVFLRIIDEENDFDRYWMIDNMQDNIPQYLHEFASKVKEKVEIIHE
jgi:hypothetical protein